MQAGTRGGATQRAIELLATPGARGVIGRGQGETQHPDERRQAAFRLPQGQGEDEPERQRGFDGEIGIRPLPATVAAAHGLPRGDRIRGQPHGDLASLDQRSVVCRPIPDVVFCRVLRVHARRHVEIMHLPVATMARRSIVAHRGRGIRAPTPRRGARQPSHSSNRGQCALHKGKATVRVRKDIVVSRHLDVRIARCKLLPLEGRLELR